MSRCQEIKFTGFFKELFINCFFNKDSSGCDAVLTLVKENAAQGGPHRAVQVKVGENDQRALPAQLERDFLKVRLGAGGHDGVADLGAASEAEFPHLRVVGDGLAADAASSGQNVNDARRNSGFVTQLSELERRQRANLESNIAF